MHGTSRGVVKAPGVNLLLPSDPSRRIRTLQPGDEVEILDGVRWLRVEIDGVAGMLPAAALEARDPTARPPRPPGLARLAGAPRLVGEPVLAHVDFHPALRRLDAYAALAGVELHVTRSWEPLEPVVERAPIPPARRSNHLVGHAIDVAVVVGGRFVEARRLRRHRLAALPAAVRYLIAQVRDDPALRWGGDFVRSAPGHVDDDLYHRDPDRWMELLGAR